MRKARTLRELFSFPGFIAKQKLEGQFGDHKARTIILNRKKKLRPAQNAASFIKIIMIEKFVTHAISILKDTVFIFAMKDAVYIARDAKVYAWRH